MSGAYTVTFPDSTVVTRSDAKRTIEKKANSNGVVFALLRREDNGTFEVWKLCANHDSMIRGGIRKSWRYVERGMTEAAARALLARRTK